MSSHLGVEIVLTKHVKSQAPHDEANTSSTKTLIKEADDNLAVRACVLISVQEKYGSVLPGLESQKSLKNEQFSKRS